MKTLLTRQFIYLFIVLFGCTTTAKSQNNCLETIHKANEAYNKGQFANGLELSRACATASASGANWQAMKVMVLCHLGLNQSDSARLIAEQMLALNPTYKGDNLNDPIEFLNLIRSITLIPKLSMGLSFSLGSNFTRAEVNRSFLYADYRKNYRSKGGLMIDLAMDYRINKKSSINTGLLFCTNKYNIQYEYSTMQFSNNEKLSYLNIPLVYKYHIRENQRTSFEIMAGFYGGYLFRSRSDFNTKDNVSGNSLGISGISLTDRWFSFNYGAMSGIGITHKMRNGHLALQAMYLKGLKQITRSENRYKYHQIITDYFYLDDNIRLNCFGLNIGYIYYINYKIIK